ncbi:phospholipase A, partial [Paraburkholderia sp. Ac-20347]|uniref:phospholipase A n=1 Tax=Paraburkholderia sp. Ac-20347 TaxID=2703892 RepID=UPI0019805457
ESAATSPAQVAAIEATGADSAIAPAADSLATTGRSTLARLSYYEPMYVAVGKNGDTTARFQLSFKYRIIMPDDLRSKALFDNLYFAYTQTSIWDLSATSAPFRDTSYMPQLFYYIPDTGWKSDWFTRMGIAAGVGHESNGQAGPESRGINIVFVRPTWEFGNVDDYHVTVSPKLYYYLSKSDNEDIADYRGYMDLLIKYGSPDGWQLATTLRKGTKHWYGSVDTQLTYPLARLLGSKWGGYLWVGYFNGYGEDLLDYNQRQHWVARIGYSIAR